MKELLPGVTIRLGGREWTVPPLTLGQLRRLKPEIGQITSNAGALTGEVVDAIIRIVATAMQRNYPELAEEAVGEMLDLGNAGSVLNAVLAGSGLRRSSSPGEELAASGDGMSSMASSPPLLAGGPEISTN